MGIQRDSYFMIFFFVNHKILNNYKSFVKILSSERKSGEFQKAQLFFKVKSGQISFYLKSIFLTESWILKLIGSAAAHSLSWGFILEEANQEDHRLLILLPQIPSHRARVLLRENGVPTPSPSAVAQGTTQGEIIL